MKNDKMFNGAAPNVTIGDSGFGGAFFNDSLTINIGNIDNIGVGGAFSSNSSDSIICTIGSNTNFIENPKIPSIESDLNSFKSLSSEKIKALVPEQVIGKIIYNNTGYDARYKYMLLVEESQNYQMQEGIVLNLDETTPIYYNIFLPKGPLVNGVLVETYGGGAFQGFREYLDIMPSTMLSKNIAIITLNLIDTIELKVRQSEMPQQLHKKIHASINQFYEALTSYPEKIHPDLKILTGQKIYLCGGSFGGRTAVKHSELYPSTFDGYISFDGGLSYEMKAKSDLKHLTTDRSSSNQAKEALKWLCPSLEIEKIKDPILVVHNFDDNNVNVKVSLDWCQKVKEIGKGGLVRAIFPDKGNNDYGIGKGHGLSGQKDIFDHLTDTVFNFIIKGVSKLESLTDLRVFKTNILANKNYISATSEEQFISEAYRTYRKIQESKIKTKTKPIDILKNWDDTYLPILKKFCLVSNKIEIDAKHDLVSTIIEEQKLLKSLWQEAVGNVINELPSDNIEVTLLAENLEI